MKGGPGGSSAKSGSIHPFAGLMERLILTWLVQKARQRLLWTPPPPPPPQTVTVLPLLKQVHHLIPSCAASRTGPSVWCWPDCLGYQFWAGREFVHPLRPFQAPSFTPSLRSLGTPGMRGILCGLAISARSLFPRGGGGLQRYTV